MGSTQFLTLNPAMIVPGPGAKSFFIFVGTPLCYFLPLLLLVSGRTIQQIHNKRAGAAVVLLLYQSDHAEEAERLCLCA